MKFVCFQYVLEHWEFIANFAFLSGRITKWCAYMVRHKFVCQIIRSLRREFRRTFSNWKFMLTEKKKLKFFYGKFCTNEWFLTFYFGHLSLIPVISYNQIFFWCIVTLINNNKHSTLYSHGTCSKAICHLSTAGSITINDSVAINVVNAAYFQRTRKQWSGAQQLWWLWC